MNAYFISGLGADEKMFIKTVLPKGYTEIHLSWIRPDKNESFAAYAKRLSLGIDKSEPFILIGLSLGGMLSIEISKFLDPAYIILISSVTNHKALPLWFKIAGRLGIYKIIPSYFYHHRTFVSSWLLGATSREDKKLLSEVMQNADPHFVKWAIPRILNWDNQLVPENMRHLHGTRDVILPYKKNNQTYPIHKGTHFMVYNKATVVNELLSSILTKEVPAKG